MPGVLLLGWDHTNNQAVKVAVDENGIVQMNTTVGALNDIGDVDVDDPTDLYILYWNNTNEKWECRAFTDWTHKTAHQSGGGDEINVGGLSGELADDQPPKAHASDHQNGGGDEINVAGLSGLLADDQHVIDAEVVSAVKADAGLPVASITFIIDGGGSAITTGQKGHLEVPFACTINRVTMLADQSGSIVVDIWKDSYANFPPTDADSITAAAPPTISAAQKSQDSTLTDWTTAISAGDILAFNVDSCATITRATLALKVTKT